ncbi:MAG TPA: aminotransferase [Caulobacteraceae bacterium]|nr:aminotransferase [Caulobacteraceae bacterium]
MALRNYDNTELRALDVAHHLPAQADWGSLAKAGGSRVITRGEGCYIWDAEGHRLLDGMAGLWCVEIGYGREELARAAYEQMRELAYYNTFFRTAAPPTIRLAAKVAELLGGELGHVFFNSSGSEAVDTVVRLVRRYWQVRGESERTIIISRNNGYHGSTVAGVSVGGMGAMRAQGGPWVPDIEHIMQPYFYGEGGEGESEEAFGERAANALEERILEVGPQRVAAFIGEPVQGAGGVIVPPAGYWKRIEAICRRHGILLVSDEVICGFGRLGAWFGFQHFGVTPDLVSMAKGLSSGYLPISAVGVARHVVETLREKGGDFFHGYTYSGHPTCAAVALANLEIMEREDLVRRTAEVTAPHLARAFASLADHPLVGEARTIGLLGAIEIVADKKTRARFGGKEGTAGPAVRDACIRNGLMVRGIRDSIVACPPLVISGDQIDDMTAILRQSLDEAQTVLTGAKAA